MDIITGITEPGYNPQEFLSEIMQESLRKFGLTDELDIIINAALKLIWKFLLSLDLFAFYLSTSGSSKVILIRYILNYES